MNAFVYPSLETDGPAIPQAYPSASQVSIRLLELQPGGKEDELSCKLIHVDLSQRVNYEALSYTWGIPSRIHSVKCDDAYLKVTETLREALTTLRLPQRKRMLWIDQLCINQEDVEERSSQVKVMHLIYKHATRTIVFLATGDAPVLNFRLSRRRMISALRKAHSQGESKELAEYRRLFKQAWFERVWIMQEIGMSDASKIVVLYRGVALSWNNIRGAAGLLAAYSPGCKYDFVQLPPSVVRHRMIISKWTAMGPGTFQFATLDRYAHLYYTANRWWYSVLLLAQEPRLEELLQDSRYYLATDPKDKIYSLLNMLQINLENDLFAWLLKVDYSLPLATIYARAARYSIETECSLEILSYKQGISDIAGLPSWVPDWTRQQLFPINRIALILHLRSQFHNQAWPARGLFIPLRATRNRKSVASFSTDGTMMTLAGYYLDTIETFSAIWSSALDVPDEALFFDWATIYTGGKASEIIDIPFKADAKPKGIQVTPRSICDFWLRVGRHPRLKTSDTLKPFQSNHPVQKEWRKCPYHRSRRGRTLLLHRKGNLAFLFYFDWLAMMLPYASVGRRIAATKDGYILLIPPETRKDDEVYFLNGGGSLGYVLRRKEGSDGHRLVGAAYVHGFYGVKAAWRPAKSCSLKLR